MESLIETLLILAREEKAVLPVQDVDINSMALKQLDTLESLFKDKAVSVSVDEQAKLVVKAPESVVSILMSNLLRNAFNYTPQGNIVIKIWEQGFSITDSGVGMSEQQVKNVFEPFYRGEGNNNEKGYGLGMTIVKRLCNRYDWHLRVTSELGKGTEVSVHFPKSQIEI
jgi:signal transduction histidine kinase